MPFQKRRDFDKKGRETLQLPEAEEIATFIEKSTQ